MKAIIFVLTVVCTSLIFMSCQEQSRDSTSEEQNSEVSEGSILIANSDCFSCHKIAEPATGPAYINIAKKYSPTAENRDLLISRIIAGGSGVWGQVPMTPHPNLSKEDAGKMVDYIFTLKNN